jgi:hypothetical protein
MKSFKNQTFIFTIFTNFPQLAPGIAGRFLRLSNAKKETGMDD